MNSTTGRYRGLSTLSTPENVFAVLAIDHRDSMRAVLSLQRVAPRFQVLTAIARTTARPWTAVIEPPPVPDDWYQTY